MYRHEINKYVKKYVKLAITKNLYHTCVCLSSIRAVDDEIADFSKFRDSFFFFGSPIVPRAECGYDAQKVQYAGYNTLYKFT